MWSERCWSPSVDILRMCPGVVCRAELREQRSTRREVPHQRLLDFTFPSQEGVTRVSPRPVVYECTNDDDDRPLLLTRDECEARACSLITA
jgi:hypothetical protein